MRNKGGMDGPIGSDREREKKKQQCWEREVLGESSRVSTAGMDIGFGSISKRHGALFVSPEIRGPEPSCLKG